MHPAGRASAATVLISHLPSSHLTISLCAPFRPSLPPSLPHITDLSGPRACVIFPTSPTPPSRPPPPTTIHLPPYHLPCHAGPLPPLTGGGSPLSPLQLEGGPHQGPLNSRLRPARAANLRQAPFRSREGRQRKYLLPSWAVMPAHYWWLGPLLSPAPPIERYRLLVQTLCSCHQCTGRHRPRSGNGIRAGGRRGVAEGGGV